METHRKNNGWFVFIKKCSEAKRRRFAGKVNGLLYFQDYVWDASHYLVRLVFTGLKEMFTGTREIQVGP